MKSLLSLFFIISLSMHSQEKDTVTVILEFEITKYNKGNIFIAFYDSEEHHMKKSIKSGYGVVEDNKVKLKVSNLKKGSYSFSYFHDVNGNKKLDKNFMKIPKEPYGFSNDKKGRFGPPSFGDSKILIEKDTTITIQVK